MLNIHIRTVRLKDFYAILFPENLVSYPFIYCTGSSKVISKVLFSRDFLVHWHFKNHWSYTKPA